VRTTCEELLNDPLMWEGVGGLGDPQSMRDSQKAHHNQQHDNPWRMSRHVLATWRKHPNPPADTRYLSLMLILNSKSNWVHVQAVWSQLQCVGCVG
jgi:hypothetical protein